MFYPYLCYNEVCYNRCALYCYRTEINRRGCVLRTLQLANEGCSMDNVVRISQQPEFREGILDSVEPDCGE